MYFLTKHKYQAIFADSVYTFGCCGKIRLLRGTLDTQLLCLAYYQPVDIREQSAYHTLHSTVLQSMEINYLIITTSKTGLEIQWENIQLSIQCRQKLRLCLLMEGEANNLELLFIFHSTHSSDNYLHYSHMLNRFNLPKIFTSL